VTVGVALSAADGDWPPADRVHCTASTSLPIFSSANRATDILGLVVDGRVEAEVLDDPSALVRPARDADRPASLDLGDLPGDAPDGTGRP